MRIRIPARTLVAPLSAVLLGVLTWAPPAAAQDISGAANAFSRAQKAELSGDHATAAELFELADSLAPAPEALRSALRARKAAGQLKGAAVHAEALLSRYPDDERSRELAEETLGEAAESLVRYEVDCSPEPCQLVIDGAAAGADAKEHHIVYMDPGQHEVMAVFGSQQTDPEFAEGDAGDRGSLSFEAPPVTESRFVTGDSTRSTGFEPGADPGETPSKGLSPWYFAVGTVVTAGLGAATVWSGLDVLSAHEEYEQDRTEDGYQDGRERERRTNILIGATAAAGVTTGVLAILTQWKQPKSEQAVRAGIDVGATGGFISVRGAY